MLGGMLAGHDQSGGEVVERGGKKVKLFYGMSSATAMKKHAGGVAEYRASEGGGSKYPYTLQQYLKANNGLELTEIVLSFPLKSFGTGCKDSNTEKHFR